MTHHPRIVQAGGFTGVVGLPIQPKESMQIM